MAYADKMMTGEKRAALEKDIQREIRRLTQSDAPSLAPTQPPTARTGKLTRRNRYVRDEALRRIKDINKQKSIMEQEAANQSTEKFAPKESRGRSAQGSAEKNG